jgi:uncharacterized damage-inducible protein DinB
MLQTQLLKLTHFNLWANTLLMDWLIKAGEEKADVICQSSFPTTRKTLYHIYDAEFVWILRLNNQTLEDWPPSKHFTYSLSEFKEVFLKQSQMLIDFVNSLDENKISEMLTYKNVKGDAFQNSIADIINHVVNHGTYHRGQLVTMLRTVGFTEVSSTDYITFCRL